MTREGTHCYTITISGTTEIPITPCPVCGKPSHYKSSARWFLKPMRGMMCGTCGYWFDFQDVPKVEPTT